MTQYYHETLIDAGTLEKYYRLTERIWEQRLLSEQLWSATESFIQSEFAVRKFELAKKLGTYEAVEVEFYASSEQFFNHRGIFLLGEAKDSLDKFMESPKFQKIKGKDMFWETENRHIFLTAERVFENRVLQLGLPSGEDAQNLMDVYRSKAKLLANGGLVALTDHMIDLIDELQLVRKRQDRGRAKASWPKWKYIIIGLLVSYWLATIAIAAVSSAQILDKFAYATWTLVPLVILRGC